MSNSEKKTCFVIAPIGEEGTETRKRSDDVLNYIIKPVVQELGYKAVRSDQISKPGMITMQIIQLILDAHLLIADLTDENPNVFYELAVRDAFQKPSIQLLAEGQSLPFDMKDRRTIFLTRGSYGSGEEAKAKLREYIKAIEADPNDVHTPISAAVDLSRLQSSGEPTEEFLGGLITQMAGFTEQIRLMYEQLQLLTIRQQTFHDLLSRVSTPRFTSTQPSILGSLVSDTGLGLKIPKD